MGLPPTDQVTSGSERDEHEKLVLIRLFSRLQSHMEAMATPFLYNFSSAVVPHPIDWRGESWKRDRADGGGEARADFISRSLATLRQHHNYGILVPRW